MLESQNKDLPIGPKVVPFWEYPIRMRNMNPKKELLWGLWVKPKPDMGLGLHGEFRLGPASRPET